MNAKALTTLPGNPMPCAYGVVILAHMDIPDHQGTPMQLLVDAHNQQYICFKTAEDDHTERWLMVPAHPSKLLRSLNGESHIMSAVGNADYILAQDRAKSGATLLTHMISQEQIEAAAPNFPDLSANIILTLDQLMDWTKTVRESWHNMPW